MNQQTINAIVEELRPQLKGRHLGKVFQLTQFTLALDFRLRDGSYLLISVDPKRPRTFLIHRRVRELEKQSVPLGQFAQVLRSTLTNAKVTAIEAESSERVVYLRFSGKDEIGNPFQRVLVAQLTGRSANLLLLNEVNVITHTWRPPKGEGQQIGQVFQPPPQQQRGKANEATSEKESFPSLSAALDDYFTKAEAAEQLAARFQAIRDRTRKQIAHRQKLKVNLENDLLNHGDAEQHKRLGDLLLANLATADRVGAVVRLKDYFSEGEPMLEIEVEPNKTLQEAASEYFSRYTKSKKARGEIARRMAQLEVELEKLNQEQNRLARIATDMDEAALASFEEPKKSARTKQKDLGTSLPGVRRYRSSDGYEILVGKAARTNDQLTFKVAKPHDLWLHAADYPGSHVVVRNSTRNEIPQRTMIEAAQLAAKFSQAGDDAKVNVHYAQRKFLSKPKGAAPGLVRMSSFKTITVTPGENVERI